VGQSLDSSKTQGWKATKAIDAEKEAAWARRLAASEGSRGGAIDCAPVSRDHELWSWCSVGSCAGFADDYPLWSLCENDQTAGFSDRFSIWNYLETGNASGLPASVYGAADDSAGTFADRKRFVIYYLRGFVLRSGRLVR